MADVAVDRGLEPGVNGAHDVGGFTGLGQIPIEDREPVFSEPWEGRVLAMCLSGVVSGTFSVDHHKAAVGGMHPVAYMASSYYEQWLYALEVCLVAAGALTREEIEERVAALANNPDAPLSDGDNPELTERLRLLLDEGAPQARLDREPRFRPGDEVETRVIRVRPGEQHTSLPGYAQGRHGVVTLVHRPEPLGDAIVAGEGAKPEYVYSVRFRARELWSGGGYDSVTVDLFESYIEPTGKGSAGGRGEVMSAPIRAAGAGDPAERAGRTGGRVPAPTAPAALRTRAIESLMLERGLVTEEMIELVIRTYEGAIGPGRGARVVARAWSDEGFKRRLLADATEAMHELGIGGFAAECVVALENTSKVHNVVVSTLQACYPWALLGLAPRWYKSPEYRARVVRDPRGTLHEFGVELPEGTEVRVWDSTAEVRYLVIPERPVGSEGMTEEGLIGLVTRDAMIGTRPALEPPR